MPKENLNQELLVEGKDDKHVIWALCSKHNVIESFRVNVSGDGNGGIEMLLDSIPVRLKVSKLKVLGVVLDADQNLQARWQSVRHRFGDAGYLDFPETPDAAGTILHSSGRPSIGVWLMPDNQIQGMLENFVTRLIPDSDKLRPKAEAILHEIELEGLNRYTQNHHTKAFIHTWLAWQDRPGQPMGQAITAHTLVHNEPLATAFVGWLNRLFNRAS